MIYELLRDISGRPQPFSRYTARELWTRPHLARQMLRFHLDQETDLASRRFETIDQVVNWIDAQLNLSGKRVCDLGCGPGLYAMRFADKGADVTGIDFSSHSLEYARLKANEGGYAIRYQQADYLQDELPAGFDVVTLIYTDYCVLSPAQRKTLLGRIREMLKPGGKFVMDVSGTGSFAGKQDSTRIENRLMGGYWAEGDYVGIHQAFVYKQANLSLDRYTIVEPHETWEIFNWFQHFTEESLRSELGSAGFEISQMAGDLTGKPLTSGSDFIAVIAGT
jgi:SAM-dependent methyltransferase